MCVGCKHNSINCPHQVEYGLLKGGMDCPHYEKIDSRLTSDEPSICVICGRINTNEHEGKIYCKECEKKWR